MVTPKVGVQRKWVGGVFSRFQGCGSLEEANDVLSDRKAASIYWSGGKRS